MKKKTGIDFTNTEIAFRSKSNPELRKSARLFSMMNSKFLVNLGTRAGLAALRMGLPIHGIVKATIFEQFCGGTNFEECKETVDKLWEFDMLTILDYGAEAKESEKDLDFTRDEIIRAVQFGYENTSVAVVSCKITGLCPFDVLEKRQTGASLSVEEEERFKKAKGRIDTICKKAHEYKVGVFIDAEESWIQDTIDELADEMMAKYNKKEVIVYNTFQMYRSDRLEFLKASFEKAEQGKYLLGTKIVRGAYMEKERARAVKLRYDSPIQPNKTSTDNDFNEALNFCLEHIEKISVCNATHNEDSCRFMVEKMKEKNIKPEHKHINCCQLYGMSDHLSFNLKASGFNVAKYVPYGEVEEVIPYLIRRARENTSVTGDMGREWALLRKEIKRRKIK